MEWALLALTAAACVLVHLWMRQAARWRGLYDAEVRVAANWHRLYLEMARRHDPDHYAQHVGMLSRHDLPIPERILPGSAPPLIPRREGE